MSKKKDYWQQPELPSIWLQKFIIEPLVAFIILGFAAFGFVKFVILIGDMVKGG